MLKKYVVSAALAASVVAGVGLASGTANAATTVPGGVYPSQSACNAAGNAGLDQGRWVGWSCAKLRDNQGYLLWVQPIY